MEKKDSKTIEKVIEKESEKILKAKDVANNLLIKIAQANNELNTHLAKSKKKTKTVKIVNKIEREAERITIFIKCYNPIKKLLT